MYSNIYVNIWYSRSPSIPETKKKESYAYLCLSSRTFFIHPSPSCLYNKRTNFRPRRIVMQYDARIVESKEKENERKGSVLQQLAPPLTTRFSRGVCPRAKNRMWKKENSFFLRRLTPLPYANKYATHMYRKEKEKIHPPETGTRASLTRCMIVRLLLVTLSYFTRP